MKELTRVILYNSIISSINYLIVYLIRSFIIWQFNNPFQWIIDIPTEGREYRMVVLFCVTLYYGILSTLVYGAKDELKKELKF